MQWSDSTRTKWDNSEVNAAVLDDIRNHALGINTTAIDGVIVVIAHLGTGERTRQSNWRRLHNVRRYFVDHGIPPERVITAEGTPSNGKATVELYLGGRLRLEITADRDKDVRVDCCDEFPQYFPWYRGKPILK
jgi:hypothetical protein